MWKLIQNYLFAKTDEGSRNIKMKNPCLKAGSSVITEGSQEEAENEASEDSRLRDSTQISEQKDSQIKETKRRLGEAQPETKQISAEIKPKTQNLKPIQDTVAQGSSMTSNGPGQNLKPIRETVAQGPRLTSNEPG